MFSIHNLFRFFNKNIRNIIIGIIVTIFVIGFIQLFNSAAKEKEVQGDTYTEKSYIEQKKSYSVLTQETVSENTTIKNTNIINEFIDFCNNGKIEEAYSLISDECKNIYYKNIEEFKEYYYNNIFSYKKEVDMQAWTTSDLGTTYRVEFSEDILSSGKYNKDNYIEDYYTIIKDKNGNKKININSFIGTKTINKTASKNNIEINCVEKEVYKEYEIYKFEVSNNTDNKIKLDSRELVGTVYLKGENEIKYTAFMHELSDYNLEVDEEKSKEIKIKFNKFYNPDIKTESIVFENIIRNYNEQENKMSINISIK